MNIVLFNWAPIWKGAQLGGGVNGYLHALGPALAERGHEVTSISAGLLHTRHPEGCFSRRHEDFRGVRVIEIVNSPVLAPSAAQFREPMTEVSAPDLEAELERLLRLIRPQVAHWHNLEGFSAGCVDVCRHVGAKVVYSLHNYHTLCSQVTLCRGHEKPCHNFEAGHACSTCIPAPDPFSERVRRQNDFAPAKTRSRTALEREHDEALAGLKHELSWPKRLLQRGTAFMRTRAALRREDLESTPHPLPGKAAESLADLALAPRASGKRVALPVIGAAAIDAAYAARAGGALANRAERDPTSGRLLGPHARRRAAMVAMLGRCDRVLAVSEFVRAKYEAEGVDPARLQTVHIGTLAAEGAVAREIATRPEQPMRMVFLGYNHFNKGLPLLLAALRGMPGERLRRLGLSIYAPGVQSIGPEFRRLHPPLAELNIRDRYEPSELGHILGGHDVCYVGSSWWDPLPQTALESLALGVPVLGAEAGGIPDAVRDGENGFLFRANDPADLRARLAHVLGRFCDGDWPRVIKPPKSITAHADELAGLYAELLGIAPEPRAARSREAEHAEHRRVEEAPAWITAHHRNGAGHAGRAH